MIKSKSDYRRYLTADYQAMNLPKGIWRLIDRRYRFYKSLRKTEYYTNCRTDYLGKIIGKFYRLRHYYLCDKYNWTIPINVFGKGLQIPHSGTIVVSGHARIGDYCRIHVCTNIGWAPSHGTDGAPVLGDRVYIGPGVVVFGAIKIGNDTAIGANSVVNKSFDEGCCTIGGAPARIISSNTSRGYMPAIAYSENNN